jgi:hypothetical protein
MTVNYELEGMWKKRSWPNLEYYLGICLEGMRETTKAVE